MDKPTVETSAAPVETLVLTEPPAETQAEDSVSSTTILRFFPLRTRVRCNDIYRTRIS
ncbi:surface protein [Frog virus 3]|uniref:Surface protein n=1 Tax=Frog virus 3 TaxID=10493 RepID=A0A5B8P1T5_FRG3V|nr:surface protein [Frog virus 3]